MTRPIRAFVAVVAGLLLLAACGGSATPRADSTWVPKPEGPPPAELPDQQSSGTPGPPGQSGGGGGGPEPGEPGDPNVVATGLTLPWGLAVLPDGSALVGERTTGRLLQVQPQPGQPVRQIMKITGLDTTGDGGLLGLALSPRFADDGLVYAYITTKADNRVVRFALRGPTTPVLVGIPRGRTGNGGQLAFDANGILYVGTGDAGKPASAADPKSLAGKVLRITAFGKAADGNPDPTSAVWTRGHKQVAGLCLDARGRVYAAEPATGVDEVNQLRAGADYGWPTAAAASRKPALTLPTAAAGFGGCAIIERGMFIATLTGKRLLASPVDEAGVPGQPQALLPNAYGRLRTVVAAPDGALWLTTSNKDGLGKPTKDDDRVIRYQPPSGTTNSPV